MTAVGDAGSGRDPSTDQMGRGAQRSESTWDEKVRTVGGLLAVVAGVLAVGTIAVVALAKNTSTAATIASASGGVIATIVGAYFGVKVGSDQSRAASSSQRAEAAKAQVYAAHPPAEEAPAIIDRAEAAARDVLGK
jgi:hypothetical protein